MQIIGEILVVCLLGVGVYALATGTTVRINHQPKKGTKK